MAGILRTDTIQNSNTSTIITQTNSTTITIGTSGQTIALASGATSSGFGATYNGAINWDTTAKTTGFTAVSGTGYFCNTTSGAFTVTLPLSPSAGSIVAFKDYAQTWNTNNLTIGRNGSNIEGAANNYIANTAGLSVTLIYVDSTKGWVVANSGDDSNITPLALYVAATGGTVTTCGNFKIHSFTGPGSFVVSCAGNSTGSNSVEYLVLAGGGGGGTSGGGAGGFRQNYPSPAIAGLPVTATTYPITVGGGGTAGSNSNTGGSGSNSIFSTITSAGGGAGVQPSIPGTAGGSGGGGGSGPFAGGAGNTPPVSPPQGNNGGAGGPSTGAPDQGYPSGGGGGAGATGQPGPSNTQSGAGGAGSANSISGSSITYGGGGGGAGWSASGGGGAAGSGGGGAGGSQFSAGTSGTANRGGGGGGGGNSSGTNGAGGSGIVIIRYKYQ